MNASPAVFSTDCEKALMSAIGKVFPQSTLILCIWHINKNLLVRCRSWVGNRWDEFLSMWNKLINSATEQEYEERKSGFFSKFSDHKRALLYLTNQWLPFKSHFVACFLNCMHLGTLVTSRVEGAHSLLKNHLQTGTLDLPTVAFRIHIMLKNQFTEIKAKIDKDRLFSKGEHRLDVFQNLLRKISQFALDKVFEQFQAARTGTASSCTGKFTKIWGLPCQHFIKDCMASSTPIPLSSINGQWILEMEETFHGHNGETRSILEEIQETLEHPDVHQQSLVARLRNVVRTPFTGIIAPVLPQGRSINPMPSCLAITFDKPENKPVKPNRFVVCAVIDITVGMLRKRNFLVYNVGIVVQLLH